MKIKVWCDSGANIHSCREEIVDLEKEWNISDDEWNEMSENERHEMALDWAWGRLDIGCEEVE